MKIFKKSFDKKKIILIGLLAFFYGLLNAGVNMAGDTFQIRGIISNAENGTMMLMYMNGQDIIYDSSGILNGQFNFNGSVKFPTRAKLYLKGSKHQYAEQNISFFLENSDIQIRVNKDSMITSVIKGSRSNDDKDSIDAMLKPLYDSYTALRTVTDFAAKNHLSSVSEGVEKLNDELHGSKKKLIADYAISHPSSFAVTTMLDIVFSNDQSGLPVLKRIYNNFSPQVRESDGGKNIEALIKRVDRVQLGKLAPGFSLPDEKGKMVNLSSFKGKYVLLDFWASWCVPCRAEAPYLVKAFNKFHSDNFTILSVSLDVLKDKEKWLEAIKKDGMVWTNLSSLKGYGEEGVRLLYSVQGIPDNFLINPEGKIIARGLRGIDVEKKLAEIIKQNESL